MEFEIIHKRKNSFILENRRTINSCRSDNPTTFNARWVSCNFIMRNYVLLIILVFLVQSCSSDYKDFLYNAPTPYLVLSKDTVVTREKDYLNINQTDNGKVYMKTANWQQQLNIQIFDSSGKVHFKYMGAQLQSNQPLIVAGDSTWVFIAVDTAGLYKVDFLITDQLGKTTKQSLFVKSLANTAPVASLSVTLIDSSQINNWTYNLDASTSKKSDGSIISFIYNINGQAITSSKNAIRWTFHERGWQRISLFVTDDLKRASDSTIQKLFIQ